MVWIEIVVLAPLATFSVVTTFAVVWIEIVCRCTSQLWLSVTTFAVVWIEIDHAGTGFAGRLGHHLRGGVD